MADSTLIQAPTIGQSLEYQKSWQALRKSLDRIPLHRAAIATNAGCRAWAEGDVGPARLGPGDSALKEMPAHNAAWRWAAAKFIRHAVLWCPVTTADSRLHVLGAAPTDKAIWRMTHVSALQQLELAPADERVLRENGVEDFLHETRGPQHLLERWSRFRLGQTALLWSEALAHRAARDPRFPADALRDHIVRVLGMDVTAFARMVGLVFGASLSGRPIGSQYGNEVPRHVADMFGLHLTGHEGLLTRAISRVIGHLAAGPDSMKAWMSQQVGQAHADDGQLLRAPNPLHRYPLLRPFSGADDRCVAPVPELVFEWLNEPLTHAIWSAFGADAVGKRWVADVFEEYVGLLCERCSPNRRPWLGDQDFGGASGEKLVDWAAPIGDFNVLVEAKRAFVEPVERYRLNIESAQMTSRTIMAGVRQVIDFARRVRRGGVPRLIPSRRLVGMVVVQSDLVVHGGAAGLRDDVERAGVEAHVPIVVLSLDQFNSLMTAWWRSARSEWLPSAIIRIAERGIGEMKTLCPDSAEGPLWQAGEILLEHLPRAL